MTLAETVEQPSPRDEQPLADLSAVARMVKSVADGLKELQAENGHWAFELEADATIPSEFILLEHFLGEIDDEVEAKLAVYIRERQAVHDGWPLFYGGDFNISATVKAYFALKLVGDDADAPHMARAREAILAHGGAARCNVFSRFTLALFGQVPWRAVPTMPVEIMLLPSWSPFRLDMVSYWSRTVIVPLDPTPSEIATEASPATAPSTFTTPPWVIVSVPVPWLPTINEAPKVVEKSAGLIV